MVDNGPVKSSTQALRDARVRVLLVSIVPPRNDCGVRIVMYRHFVDRSPFELHVASNADFADGLLIHTQLRLPYVVHRLRRADSVGNSLRGLLTMKILSGR